jgi:hypothetical protein
VRADTPGQKVNRATLVNVDGTEGNNGDNETITATSTCGDPFANGTKLACSAGTYNNNDSRVISSLEAFATLCCVSGGWCGVGNTAVVGLEC